MYMYSYICIAIKHIIIITHLLTRPPSIGSDLPWLHGDRLVRLLVSSTAFEVLSRVELVISSTASTSVVVGILPWSSGFSTTTVSATVSTTVSTIIGGAVY